MRLWRISRYPSLDGQGGRLASNRWHDAPRSIVYCADHPSTALIEVLVHLEVEFDDLPKDYKLLEIEIPDISSVRVVSEADLNEDWQNSEDLSRLIGNSWFDENRYLRLSTPSAVLPDAQIHLLNVGHREFSEVKPISVNPIWFDRRLWKTN